MARDRDAAARAYRSALDGGERNAAARLGMLIAIGAVPGQVTDGARLVRDAAEYGNAEGAFLWSELLRAGRAGMVRDDLEAIRWLRRAADGGSAQAAAVLAVLYESGNLVPQDASLARQWRERAATMRPKSWETGPSPVPPESQDVRNWQRQMDLAAERGDNAEYFRLAQLLARHGKANAQAVVASFHESGTVVPRDYAQAESWYRKAVTGGSDMGRIRLALMIGRKQASGTNQEAFDLIRLPAQSGRPEAEYLKGMMLIQGLGVAADPVEAVYWLRRAALKGHADGAIMVAAAYHDGKGVPKDVNQSRIWI
jgi:TPR repeat protein